MKIEHVAFMVQDPAAVARWYSAHLGFTIKKASNTSPFGHFLADSSGSVMLELYNNPAFKVPDYKAMPLALLHVAFCIPDVPAQRQRLLAAGATVDKETYTTPGGDLIAELRDPWGFPFQLVQRATPMV